RPRSRVECRQRVREGVLRTREAFHEVAAHDLAAVLHAEQRVAERGPVALGELSRDDAVPGEQKSRARLLELLGRETLLIAERAPATDHRELAGSAVREPTTAPPGGRPVGPLRRRGPGEDRAEGVGGHEPDPEEPPERREDFGRRQAEIGRASCRERGEGSVAAAAVNEKRN